MGRTSKTIKRSRPKFQDTIFGIIILGLITSAIWFYISHKIDTVGNNMEARNNIIENSNVTTENFKEYVFINYYCAITAITNKDAKVVAYSVTLLNSGFNPEITIETIPLKFILGKTSLYEIGGEENSGGGVLGVNWFQYNEEYYNGRSGNYQTFILSVNENGVIDSTFFDNIHTFFDESSENEIIDMKNQLRKKVAPNTITITSPFFETEKTFKDYAYGPSKVQLHLLDEYPKKFDTIYLQQSLKKIYPETDIQSFINLFGDPSFINSI
jgi:hypothetical protein